MYHLSALDDFADQDSEGAAAAATGLPETNQPNFDANGAAAGAPTGSSTLPPILGVSGLPVVNFDDADIRTGGRLERISKRRFADSLAVHCGFRRDVSSIQSNGWKSVCVGYGARRRHEQHPHR